MATDIALIAVIAERLLELIKRIMNQFGVKLPDYVNIALALAIGLAVFIFKNQIPAGIIPGLAVGGVSSYAYAVRTKLEP